MLDDVLQEFAQRVGNLTPEEYQRYGPALREIGLAIAELRQVQRDRVEAEEAYRQLLAELERVEERVRNALRLYEDAE
jgi:hypothetical protein